MAADVHQTFAVRARPEDVRLRHIPAAATHGYTLIGELPNGFAVRRRRTPGWAVVLAVIYGGREELAASMLEVARRALPWRRRAPLMAAATVAADAVGFAALVEGSVRDRTLLL